MENVCRELIYFDPSLKGKENFGGKLSPVNAEKRVEFLDKYAKYLKKTYSIGDLPEKAVKDEELKVLTQKYGFTDRQNENILYFSEMEAYSRTSCSAYLGWQFYTFGAQVQDGAICFKDGVTPPVPAAKYEFDGNERLTEIDFSFFTQKFEALPARVAVNDVRGRTFEIRSGIHTVVKLQLLTDGNLYYLDGSSLKTHPNFVFVCKCHENEWTNVRLCLHENACDVVINGRAIRTALAIYTHCNPDNFFVSGGMIPIGEWKLRLNRLTISKRITTNFFIPAKNEKDEIFHGNRKLPYAIGTFVNKDRELVFRKKFDIALKKNAKLFIKSIDPCGFVYLNGKCVWKADNFLSHSVDVAPYLKEKDNLLEIVVMPRAPEVFYQWHKHSDPYNGWFFSGCYIQTYGDNYIDDICITTDNIEKGIVSATVSAELYGKGVAEIYLKKIYPQIGAEKKIDCFAYAGKTNFSKQYDLSVTLWDTENPNIYELIIKLDDGFEKSIETGFRTIEQKDGEIRLNGKRVFLNGALSMQFLPPYEEIPVNHLCPSDEQIVMQLEQIKRMSGNTLRTHFLGYGTNDERWARYADRAGVMLIWTTRLIDSIESIFMNDEWAGANAYVEQVKDVRQYPSIIMWEGSNEAKGRLAQVDKVFDEFVTKVKKVDKTRLLCPCSHLYYGGGLYDDPADKGEYYQDDGLADHNMHPAQSSFGWVDESVVRSAHTYQITLGYGCEWDWLVNQTWVTQESMLKSKKHAYIVSEYAIIGRACPNVEEAKTYFVSESYEMINEYMAIGDWLSPEKYELSQAHQALCALYANKKMRMLDVDGMLWCCLQGGANDGSYLKPILDFYGYKKLGYYVLGDYYKKNCCVLDCDGPFWGMDSRIKPVLLAENGKYSVRVSVKQEEKTVFERTYIVDNATWVNHLEICDFVFEKAGYYTVELITKELD